LKHGVPGGRREHREEKRGEKESHAKTQRRKEGKGAKERRKEIEALTGTRVRSPTPQHSILNT
jgi:hypothetical protein